MPRPIADWETRIGRRLRLRDLHVFSTTVQCGSMAKAAQTLRVTQPAVSKAIGELEHTLGVRLLDRGARGIEPTIFGRALIARGNRAFDELRQGVRDIEFLADAAVGEVRIECQESIAAAILPPVIHRFSRAYPRVLLHVEHIGSLTEKSAALHERTVDVAFFRLDTPDIARLDDLHVETLFYDQLVVAAGRQTRWARRRKIELAELVDEPWILTHTETWNYAVIERAFSARGLDLPKMMLATLSSHLRANLASLGPYITTFPKSLLHAYGDRFSLKELPIELPVEPWPVVAATLENRTLSPVVQRFIEHVRDFTRTLRASGPATS
jgi:DNA-binding transcriptional LysR family regulator